jgi:hypothetical protein
MYSVMLPRNPLPGSFPLLDTFRSSQQIHRLIELNLVAGANFALGWVRKWHPRLNYSSMSLSYPPGGASLRVHLENTLQPARRIIARLLREDAAFFCEHHYLDPLGVDNSDNPMLWCLCALCIERESLCFLTLLSEIFSELFFGAFAAVFLLKGDPRDPANDLCSGSRGHCPGIARGFYSLIFLLYSFDVLFSPMPPRSSLLLL